MAVTYLATSTNESNINNMRDQETRCAEISSLGISAAPETTGVTSFVQEACAQQEALGGITFNKTVYSKDEDLQNLTNYFSRPVSIASGNLSTATRSRNFVYSFTANQLFGNWTNGASRLRGVYGIRFTTVFTLQVAATPFHQGVVALNFQYACDHVDGNNFCRSSFSQTSTNIPHVRLDLSSDTMVQLKVPFLYQYEYALVSPVITPIIYGSVALNTVMPIPSVVGISAPGYQILVHLEDIEFYGASPQTLAAINLQAGRSLVSKEFDDETHPFSSATMALSRAVNFVSKGVPSLSSIGGPTSWFLAKAAGALRSFGFARPTVTDPIVRMHVQNGVCEQYTDVPTAVQVIGPISSNGLRFGPEFGGTDVDEMSLSYLLKQYSQIQYFTMSTSDPAGTALYAAPTSPSACWFRTGGSVPFCNKYPPYIAPVDTNAFQPSTLFFFSSMFRYWRGSIKFRFTFAKTKMHGGRVMVGYAPTVINQGDDVRLSAAPGTVQVPEYGGGGPNPFGYSAIFNLRDGNVFEFEVPYISPAAQTSFFNASGAIVMYVVDALQAPSVVSNSVGILVEVCGGDDFELSDPKSPLWPAQTLATPTLQSGRYLGNAPENVSEYTVGEAITSVKQLISIPKASPFALNAGFYQFLIPSWFYQPKPITSLPAPTFHLLESFSFGGNIASCYAFVKGGTDFHFYSNTALVSLYQYANAQGYYGTERSAASAPNSNTPYAVSSGNGLHARLPAYQHCLRYPSQIINYYAGLGSSWAMNDVKIPTPAYNPDAPQTQYALSIVAGGSFSNVYSRSAADDASCAHFMGPPPLLLLNNDAPGERYDPDSWPRQ